ncbi:Spo0E family sporulation regulatory protein-aspartic acid phosphatase [Clostridium sp.]|jgi:hypothetical protein|uniref:Spo0E family sporulation regulatory protein-aspartic acid phosphatase n=1 Tax=Clostridium sp. TaxID=1506 RepID=UPI003FA562AF
MKTYLKNLDIEINQLKQTLYILMKTRDLTDDIVVKCSKKLDDLIFQYQKNNFKKRD